jgi:hypothetical protein
MHLSISHANEAADHLVYKNVHFICCDRIYTFACPKPRVLALPKLAECVYCITLVPLSSLLPLLFRDVRAVGWHWILLPFLPPCRGGARGFPCWLYFETLSYRLCEVCRCGFGGFGSGKARGSLQLTRLGSRLASSVWSSRVIPVRRMLLPGMPTCQLLRGKGGVIVVSKVILLQVDHGMLTRSRRAR